MHVGTILAGTFVAQIPRRVGECDEVARHHARPLMNQLVESMLTIRARLTPEDFTRVVVHPSPVIAH